MTIMSALFIGQKRQNKGTLPFNHRQNRRLADRELRFKPSFLGSGSCYRRLLTLVLTSPVQRTHWLPPYQKTLVVVVFSNSGTMRR